MMERNRRHLLDGGERSITPWDSWGIEKLVTVNTEQTAKPTQTTSTPHSYPPTCPKKTGHGRQLHGNARPLRTTPARLYSRPLLVCRHRHSSASAVLPRDTPMGTLGAGVQRQRQLPAPGLRARGRRFEGMYFFTAKDALPVTEGAALLYNSTSITASHYALDSHAHENARADVCIFDGFISYPTAVYTVPYGVIVPKEVENLLLPVPVSGSHIGFSTLRMEPCWMALGQAAGCRRGDSHRPRHDGAGSPRRRPAATSARRKRNLDLLRRHAPRQPRIRRSTETRPTRQNPRMVSTKR